MDIWIVSARIFIGLFLMLFITKLLGKTQISQITPFDFISSIVMGEIFVHAVYDEKTGSLMMLYPILLWGVLIYFFELLAEKFLSMRGFFEGNPSIVIREGRIDHHQLKRNKLNLNQLLNLLRQKDVFSMTEVKYAILEMNGSLSVLKNSPQASPTRKDLNLPDIPVFLAVTLISDGKVLMDNLKASGFNLSWLYEQLKTQGVKEPGDVFYAEWRQDKGLYLSLK